LAGCYVNARSFNRFPKPAEVSMVYSSYGTFSSSRNASPLAW
jgi:hypothetical protein